MIVPVVVALVAAAVVTTVLLVTRDNSGNASGTALAPAMLPGRATVTSALTGEPLAVTLELSGGTQVSVEANGTVAPDRVKPGDQVGVSAEGYVTAQVPVGADRTITATLQPTFATAADQLVLWAAEKQPDKIINWLLSPATGYQYHSPGGSSDYSSFSVEVVDQTAVVNITLIRGIVVNQEYLEQLYGDTAQPISIAGQSAWHGSTGEGGYGSTWVHDPLLLSVNGVDLSTTDKVLTGIVTALPAK